MVADKGRRRFLESAGAAAFASCLPAAVSRTTSAAEKKGRGPQKTQALRPFVGRPQHVNSTHAPS